MNQYLEQTNPMIKEYFKILSPEGIPEFLWDYKNIITRRNTRIFVGLYKYTRNAKTKWD